MFGANSHIAKVALNQKHWKKIMTLIWNNNTVQFCVWSLGTENWYKSFVKVCIFVRAVLINRLDSTENNLVDFCYHGLNKRISICNTSFKIKVPGKCQCIENFMDRWSRKLGMLPFFMKTNIPSSETSSCFSFVEVTIDFFVYCKKHGENQIVAFKSSQCKTDRWVVLKIASPHDLSW